MSENTTFNFQESIREVYLSVLPFQTSIYTHCLLPYSEKIGPNRLLLSPLWRDFKLYAFNKTSKKLECSEKLFPYIPEDNGIMSLNAVKLDPEEPEIITGITTVINSPAGYEEREPDYALNFYRSDENYEVINYLNTYPIEYIPYQLMFTTYKDKSLVDKSCMIVTGSDQKCHLYEFNPALQRYCSIDDGFVQPIFPELVDEFDSIPMWISVFYKNNKRITAIGFECGTFSIFIVDCETNTILETHEETFDGPVTRVVFFPPPADSNEENAGVKILVLSSLSVSKVFYNVFQDGLTNFSVLPSSADYDVPTCCTITDLDFDGKNEIIIGTYGEMFLVYKAQKDEELNKECWNLVWEKSFNCPIHGIFDVDITQDGVKEILIITLKSVIVLQHDHKMIKKHLNMLLNK